MGKHSSIWDERKLTQRIIFCIIRVHQVLGPGFLESVYRRALLLELQRERLAAEVEKEFVVRYDGREVGRHRLDILVEGRVIVELKTVETLGKAHYAQVRSYARATGAPIALLVNFAADRVDFRRIESPPPHHPPPPTPQNDASAPRDDATRFEP
jgi:GxxExxY protein